MNILIIAGCIILLLIVILKIIYNVKKPPKYSPYISEEAILAMDEYCKTMQEIDIAFKKTTLCK